MESVNDDLYMSQTLNDRAQREVYLVTYSQADLNKVPSREAFALKVIHAFTMTSGKISVLQWACCMEPHQEGGVHYHLVLKLSAKKRWLNVKDHLRDHDGITLHFSGGHGKYWDAYKYVTKADNDFIRSENHPDLAGPPKTNKCLDTLRNKRIADSQQPCSSKSKQTNQPPPKSRRTTLRRKRLTNLDVQLMIRERGLTLPDEVLSLSEEQRIEGKIDLAEFCAGKTIAQIEGIIEQAWRTENAKSTLKKKTRSRMDVIRQTALAQCSENCNGRWFELAVDCLHKNHIHEVVFADAIRNLLIIGRSKFNNIMIIGDSNTAKSFILQPLDKIFDCFLNPAVDKYAWVGVNKKECILLQDFEFTDKLISWKTFLLMLEGAKVHLPAPKNQHAKDEFFESDIPIFATSGKKIEKLDRYNRLDNQATGMMDTRWKYIKFSYEFSEEEQIPIEPCGVCFSKLVLSGEI